MYNKSKVVKTQLIKKKKSNTAKPLNRRKTPTNIATSGSVR